MSDEIGNVGKAEPVAEVLPNDEFFAALYQELRVIAKSRLRKHTRGTMLNTTALVHEAYLKLSGHDGKLRGFNDERHFYATAAIAMRQILTDQARRRLSKKRGGALRNLTLDEDAVGTPDSSIEILALDDALTKLDDLDPTLGELVSLKYFVGLGLDEIAKLQGTSTRTISRSWQKARAFLHAQIAE